MATPSIVVTGMACLCAAGSDPASVVRAMHAGTRRFTPAESIDGRALPFPFFAVPDACLGGWRTQSALDTFNLARLCVHRAVREAGLTEDIMPHTAMILGTTSGSALHFLDDYAASRGESLPATMPDRDAYFSHNLAQTVDVPLDAQPGGPRLTIANACTSGADAVGLALDMLLSGQCECAICGGADALSLVPHTGFARLMIFDSEPCRPFDAGRHGLNLGDGAAVLVLERRAHARKRRAKVLGRVLGYGAAADAHHCTAPHPEGRGLAQAIATALAQARLDYADMAFVNAHATATRENDRVEGRLLHSLLPTAPVWACKGVTGHTLGAAGALEAVLTLEALRQGRVPPSVGFVSVDEEIGLAPTTTATETATPFALSTSLGFGGSNAALVLGRGGKA